jgi:hypothetical protein
MNFNKLRNREYNNKIIIKSSLGIATTRTKKKEMIMILRYCCWVFYLLFFKVLFNDNIII